MDVEAIQQRYEKRINQLAQEAEQIGEESEEEAEGAIAGTARFEFEMREQRIKLDLPSVTMRQREVSFDVPSVTMRRKKISFSTPKVVWRDRVVGHKPEVTCKMVRNSFGLSLPECTTRMTPIITRVPETEEVTKTISLDWPEVSSRRVSFSLDIPEVTMQTQEIVLHLPSVTLVDVKGELKKAERRAGEIETEIMALATEMEHEIRSESRKDIHNKLVTQLEELREQKDDVDASFEGPVAALKATASTLKKQGAPQERIAETETQIRGLVKQWAEAKEAIDDAIGQLLDQLSKLSA